MSKQNNIIAQKSIAISSYYFMCFSLNNRKTQKIPQKTKKNYQNFLTAVKILTKPKSQILVLFVQNTKGITTYQQNPFKVKNLKT